MPVPRWAKEEFLADKERRAKGEPVAAEPVQPVLARVDAGEATPADALGLQSLAGNQAAAAALRPAPLRLPEKYKDEERIRGWRARGKLRNDDRIVTHHYSEAERVQNELRPQGGVLVGPDAAPAQRGKSLYAMSPEGRIVAHQGPARTFVDDDRGRQTRNVHHSSPFAGADVAHAGHVTVQSGKITHLDDDSGHYRPGEEHSWDAYTRLRDQGLLAKDDYARPNMALVDKRGAKTKDDREADAATLRLPFSSYEQTMGNEKQARAKQATLADIRASGAAGNREARQARAAAFEQARARRAIPQAPVLPSPPAAAAGYEPEPGPAPDASYAPQPPAYEPSYAPEPEVEPDPSYAPEPPAADDPSYEPEP